MELVKELMVPEQRFDTPKVENTFHNFSHRYNLLDADRGQQIYDDLIGVVKRYIRETDGLYIPDFQDEIRGRPPIHKLVAQGKNGIDVIARWQVDVRYDFRELQVLVTGTDAKDIYNKLRERIPADIHEIVKPKGEDVKIPDLDEID